MSHAPYESTLKKDKILYHIVKQLPGIILEDRKPLYLALCSSIMSQQLNIKVAAIIYQRFLDLYPTKKPTLPQILHTDVEILRSIGLSYNKVKYVHNVCTFFIEHKLTDSKINNLSDEALIELLTQIKGVGQWTVEMILMFALKREDVFPLDDLGIQQAIIKLYNLQPANKKELYLQMVEVAKCWQPYRTYACRFLWRYKEAESIIYRDSK